MWLRAGPCLARVGSRGVLVGPCVIPRGPRRSLFGSCEVPLASLWSHCGIPLVSRNISTVWRTYDGGMVQQNHLEYVVQYTIYAYGV